MENGKKELLTRLSSKEGELFSLISGCTREPYVECDEETFDDKVMLYFTEEEAKAAAAALAGAKIPVTVIRLASGQMLFFFTNLYAMGVNAVEIRQGEERCLIQLEEIVKRRDESQLPEGTVWVENPQLHLTAIYFAQELRKPATPQTKQRLDELQEEMAADFRKSRFIFALDKEGNGTPMVKMKNGDTFQPVFTDAVEFGRFNRENKFKGVIVEADKLDKVLSREAKGVLLNVTGVNLPLNVSRSQAPAAPVSPGAPAAPAAAAEPAVPGVE
ncbi:MAG: SseB family protein [Eubacteriales bacterium]|nr:SseB family protein [Eubacteriales bacterium]